MARSVRLYPAELHRVFPPVSTDEAARDEQQDGAVRRSETPSETAAKLVQLETENAGLREMIAALNRQLADTLSQREAWQKQAETAQRLLTDQRSRPSLLARLFQRVV